MGYTPLNLQNIELNGSRDVSPESFSPRIPADGTAHYAPPAGKPPQDHPPYEKSRALFESDLPPVKNWPQSQNVATLTPLRIFIIAFDFILASSPIMFIVLALIAARIDGKKTSGYGDHLKQALLLSPTIFPVLFAALMGRFFKALALFRAERGIALGRLEQLVGCTSLFSALERQIAIRSWSILGLFMTLLWLLSPVGGQSALRLLDTQNKTSTYDRNFHYLNPNSQFYSVLDGASNVNSGRITFAPLFLTAVLSSSKYQNTPMDLWGNVKLPPWSSVENGTDIGAGWKTVDHGANNGNGSYASLVGVPLVGMSEGVANFTFKARQWDVTCSSIEKKNANQTKFGTATSTWKLNHTDSKACTAYPCPVTFLSLANLSDSTYSVAQCNFEYQYFELNTGCNAQSCQVNYMKKLDILTDGYTMSNDNFTRGNLMSNGMTAITTADNSGVGSAGARQSTNAEMWMYDPWRVLGQMYTNVPLYTLSPEVFGQRLSIIWNSFFQATYASQALGGNLPSNLTQMADLTPPVTFNDTRAVVVQEQYVVWKTNWRWFTSLMVCSIILLIASYTGLVLKYITLAPDIIGYASSLTLLNPYVPVPTGGTTLFGLERAALLSDLTVRIGDVCPDEAVGAIAFAKADEGNVARLDRKRLYI